MGHRITIEERGRRDGSVSRRCPDTRCAGSLWIRAQGHPWRRDCGRPSTVFWQPGETGWAQAADGRCFFKIARNSAVACMLFRKVLSAINSATVSSVAHPNSTPASVTWLLWGSSYCEIKPAPVLQPLRIRAEGTQQLQMARQIPALFSRLTPAGGLLGVSGSILPLGSSSVSSPPPVGIVGPAAVGCPASGRHAGRNPLSGLKNRDRPRRRPCHHLEPLGAENHVFAGRKLCHRRGTLGVKWAAESSKRPGSPAGLPCPN